MITVTAIVRYTEDKEMIEAHCLADEIKEQVPGYKTEVKIINPEGIDENKKKCGECGQEFFPDEQGDSDDNSCQKCIDKRNLSEKDWIAIYEEKKEEK